MKHILFFLTIAGLLFMSSMLMANGGPTDFKSGAFGNETTAQFKNVPSVKLSKESLFVDLGEDITTVSVEYTLKSGTDQKIGYLFPVALCIEGKHYISEGKPVTIKPPPPKTRIKRTIRMSLNGAPLNVTEAWVTPPLTFNDERRFYADTGGWCHNKGGIMSEVFAYEVQWQTDLLLKIGDNLLKVKYSMPTIRQGSGSSSSPFERVEHLFRYDFSPALYWGDGTVENLEVTISEKKILLPSGYDCVPVECDKTSDENFWSQRLNRAQGSRKAVLTNADIRSIPPLLIDFSSSKHSAYLDIKGLNGFLEPIKLNIVKFTPSKGEYPIGNLTDGNLDTAYVPNFKPTASAETYASIEMRLPKGHFWCAISNGYLKSEDAYTNNGSLKEADIICDGKDADNLYGGGAMAEWSKNKGVFADSMFRMFEIFTDKPNTLCRLRIKDIYNGSKYSDLPLSELVCAKVTGDYS